MSKALLTRTRPSFSHCQFLPSRSLHSLLVSFIRGQTEKPRTVSQWLKQKPYYRKLITMKKQKFMSQTKGQDKIPEKQPNEVEIGNLPEIEFRIMIVKMMQDLEKEWRQRRCKKYLPNTLGN